MVFTAVTVFFVSLSGIVGLFSLKLLEERRGGSPLAPVIRGRVDSLALIVRGMLIRGEDFLSRLPSFSTYIAMKTLAASAVAFARLARTAAESSHRLADFVSHKHNFERRETRSDFLKHVSGYSGRHPAPPPGSVTRNRIQDIDVRR